MVRSMADLPSVIAIVGPTASGKTDLAQSLSVLIDGEVVSADSMQVYRGMDIGTGKIPESERVVAHHGFDLVDPGEPYSAALFQGYARDCFARIAARGKRPVLCGGTGFYVRAAIDGYDFPKGSQIDNPVREKYQSIASERGPEALWRMLADADEKSAAIIPANDVKRVVRAFELLHEGTSYAAQKEKLAELPQVVPAIFIGLSVDAQRLAERIERRVDGMFAAGLVDEVRSLLESGFREGITAPQAIGYKEVVAAIDGRITFEEASQRIKTATRRYAKRQRTWFRKDPRIHWIDADAGDIEAMTEECLRIISAEEDRSGQPPEGR